MPITRAADIVVPALWTFQRGDDTLSVMREIVDEQPALTVSDSTGTRSWSFQDVFELTLQQSVLEGELLADGWSLVAFAPDLRNGEERRRTPRQTPDRRRPE